MGVFFARGGEDGTQGFRWPLLALAIAAFTIGTSEFIIMGLLPDMARDFSVSIPKAGMLVSGYAFSVAFGAPLVAILTGRMERRAALLLFMAVYTLGNLACALAPNYGFLMGARILAALCHGAFFGTGSIVASNIVPRHQRAQAIAIMFSGLTMANILGVPAGTALGQAFGWRAAFWAIVPIGTLAWIMLRFLLQPQPSTATHVVHELRTVAQPKILLVLAMSVLSSASLFCVFTYIAPALEVITHVSPHDVTLVLMVFGIGITLGNFLGGWLSDRNQMAAIIGTQSAVLLSLIALWLAIPHRIPAVLAILLWGIVCFAAGLPLQARVVDQAYRAPNLASTLNQGAFNLGNAMGASIGGMILTLGYGYRILPLASCLVTFSGLCLSFFLSRFKPAESYDPALFERPRPVGH